MPETTELSAVERLRAAILAANDIDLEPVYVPQWKETVYVKTLSGTERERYLASITRTTGKGRHKDTEVLTIEATAKLLSRTLCDQDGNLLFTEKDVPALGKKSSLAMDLVSKVAAKLNGFGVEAEEEAKNASAEAPATNDASSTD